MKNQVQKLLGDTLLAVAGAIFVEPPPVGAPRQGFSGASLSKLLPYRMWDADRELYVNEGRLGFVIEVIPLIGADEVQGRMLEELFARGVPAGATVQVLNYASPKIGDLIDRWAKVRAQQGGVYKELGRARREFLAKGAWASASAHSPFYFRDFRIFITVEKAGELDSPVADELVEARSRFIADFKAMRSLAEVVHPQQLVELVGDILNPTTNVRRNDRKHDETVYLNEQMVNWDTAYTVYRNRLDITTVANGDELLLDESDPQVVALAREGQRRDEHFQVRGFAVSKFAHQWSQGRMSRLLGDMFNDQLRLVGPSITSLCFQNMSEEKTRTIAEFKRIRTAQAAGNYFSRMSPETMAAAEEWKWVAEEVSDKAARLTHIGMYVLSIAPAKLALSAERQLAAVWSGSGYKIERQDDIHLQTLLCSIPFGFNGGMVEDLNKMGRMRRMTSTTAAKLAPLQGEFLGFPDTPHMLLAGRRGQLFYYSIFGNAEGNHNCAVVGSSGSGKSVFMQEIAASLRGAGARVMAIDDGESFKNSCLMQGGAWIRFDLDQQICINPFSMIDEDLVERSPAYLVECKSMLSMICEQMARGDGKASDEELGILEKAISVVWDRDRSAGSIDAVIQELKSGGYGERGENLVWSMQPYAAGGTYGGYFNGPANLDITNPYTVFEMKDLESKPALRAVVILAILFLIRQKMKEGGREVKKALIIDEAWQLLADGATGKFIEGMARRCRKEGGAIITGTQSLNDYYKTSGSKACIENSDHTVVLRLKEDALEQFRNDARLQIDEATMALMKSLKVVDGEYSEMVVMVPGGKFLARLILDPYSATLYSSKPEVFAAIDGLRVRGMPLEECVREVAQRGAREVLQQLRRAA
ncbi:MAG: type-IV secretion system protein TraC [Caulobacterales bacterium 32-69-10]|nr:MAG: type-IV secretion system protein TraC [Caulobacterales bacterium 32-69-10]